MSEVTAPTILYKQPSETRKYSMDFSALMSEDETISAITSIVSELRGGGTSDLSIEYEEIEGQTITMWISGGLHKQCYRVTVIITTSGSQILEGDGLLQLTNR